MPTNRPGVQQLAAEMYLEKRDKYAREVAARNGTPYEHETVSDQRAYELFYQRDPEVDEQRAWITASQLVAAGKLEKQRLVSYVVEKVYPARIAVTEGDGRTDLKSQTAFVNRMVARRAREQQSPQTPAPAPAPVPAAGAGAEEGPY